MLDISYLGKVEHGDQPHPSEIKIKLLAWELEDNADVLLAFSLGESWKASKGSENRLHSQVEKGLDRKMIKD